MIMYGSVTIFIRQDGFAKNQNFVELLLPFIFPPILSRILKQ